MIESKEPRAGTQAELNFRFRVADEHPDDIERDIGSTGGHLDKILVTLLKVFEQHSGIGPRPLSFGMSLLNRGRQSLISSLCLVRDGAINDALALVRIALESGAVALHVVHDKAALDQFQNPSEKRYKTGSAVNYSKKHVPLLAKCWGELSHDAIHTNAGRFGPEVRSDTQYSVQVFPVRPSDDEIRHALAAIELGAELILQCAECCFLEPDAVHDGWLRIPGSNTIVTKSPHSRSEKLHAAYKRRDAT